MLISEISNIKDFGPYHPRTVSIEKTLEDGYSVIGELSNGLTIFCDSVRENIGSYIGNWRIYKNDVLIGIASVHSPHPVRIISENFTDVTISFIKFYDGYRRSGYGYSLYEWLLSKGFAIVSDVDQTNASRSLWRRLAREHRVAIWNPHTNKIGKKITDTRRAYNSHLRLLARE